MYSSDIDVPRQMVRFMAQEAKELKRKPGSTANRWVVEVAHSWFNRFRKLLVRYQKLDRSFLALNHLLPRS